MIARTGTALRARTLVWPVLGLVAVVSVVDLGSVVMTRMRVDDDLKTAGHAGATAIQGQRVNSLAAQTAYGAAASTLTDGEWIDQQTFVVRADGGVTLTVRKQAPTLVLQHLPFLDGLTEVEDTYEQSRIGY